MKSNYKVYFKVGLIIAFVAVITGMCHAQLIVNGKDVNATDAQFIQVTIKDTGFMKNNFVFNIDYGVKSSVTDNGSIIASPEGPVKLETIASMINFLNKQGWEYADAYAVTLTGNATLHYYLFKRK